MVSHFVGPRGGRGRGFRGRGSGGFPSVGRGGRPPIPAGRGEFVPSGGRTQQFCNHCQHTGHTESFCYVLHPDLRHPQAAFAEFVPTPAISDHFILSRADLDSFVRSTQVATTSAPVATLAHQPSGSLSCLFSSTSNSWVIDSGAAHHI
ncbi:hypothetical protein CFOL_v3_09549 [Cephalotus follicularis]|uniref:Uncharacterized protein n=1 Tax=Cephalotus follicularis TaxID=3775 RepID=A0A1Q3BDL5_CEPFO|nr:hypothetical protein CFOL_v3_09549 [Cephalotus follicularis]